MKPQKPRKKPATQAVVARRVEEILRIRLDGAEFWDVREYAREKEQEAGSAWELPPGEKPLSDGQLWRYIGQADKLVVESCRASQKKLMRRHQAQRRNLYAKAISAGDYRVALAAAQDEAKLQGLYPAGRVELTGEGGGPMRIDTELEALRKLPPDELLRLHRQALGLEKGGGA